MIDGTIWRTQQGPGGDEDLFWNQVGSVPIPVDQIHYFSLTTLVAKNGDVWDKNWGNGEWRNYGQPPAGPVATDQSTWGKVKAKFRGGDNK
jgi:hypothetical protein